MKKWRHWVVCAALALGSTLAAWSLSGIRFFQILNLKAYDAHFVLRGKQPTDKIVLLTADQHTLDSFPELMVFWNKHYADAIQAASDAGAKVIGLDLAFGIPIDKYMDGYDELLGGAIGQSKAPVVGGTATELNSNPAAGAISANVIMAGLGQLAFVNLAADPDDFVREQELIEASSSNPSEPPMRSLALRVAEKYLGVDAEFNNGRLTLQGHKIPISRDRKIAINYAGGPNTFPSVSLATFEATAKAGNMDQLRKWVDGKIVLIGSDTKADRFNTPFYTAFDGDKWRTAGVEVHANTIRTLLDRIYLEPVAQWARMLGLLLTTAITVVMAITSHPGRAAIWIVLEIVGILISTHLLFRNGLILSTSELMLAASICLVASVIYRFATAEKRRKLFRKAIDLFVGRQMATTLEETENIALSGKLQDVTILFTDIRGFTAFTEEVCNTDGPEKVVHLLNEYMAAMVAVIVKYHGHANKFIGDGILAVFSDDDEGAQPGDHPLRAVRCAAEMVSKPGRFETGAGLHTGPAVVGNVGSADKMEYTVLGDTVNLASRLESLNKEHHTKLLMSGATQSLLEDKVSTTHLCEYQVRGVKIPISLFTVTSLVPKAAVHV